MSWLIKEDEVEAAKLRSRRGKDIPIVDEDVRIVDDSNAPNNVSRWRTKKE